MTVAVKPQLHADTDGENLSQRHRLWGVALPATDLDLVMLELGDASRIDAIIEYKLGLSRRLSAGERFCLKGIANLADLADVPAFLVKYRNTPTWRFRVYGLGLRGKGLLPVDVELSEREFVDWLYRLRGLDEAPAEIREAFAA